MLGILKLPLIGRKHYTVHGGPYRDRTKGTIGVKMAKEIYAPCDISIPTPDFDVPQIEDLNAGLILAVKEMTRGNLMYVGCMGGKGRTGLFMAILAKAFGVKKPVEYVRENYYRHAVETKAQYEFVTTYKVPGVVKMMVTKAKFKAFFKKGWNQSFPVINKVF